VNKQTEYQNKFEELRDLEELIADLKSGIYSTNNQSLAESLDSELMMLEIEAEELRKQIRKEIKKCN